MPWRICVHDSYMRIHTHTHTCLFFGVGFISKGSAVARYDLNPGWGDMQASLAAIFWEAPWTLRRGLYVRLDDIPNATFSLYIGMEPGRTEGNIDGIRTIGKSRYWASLRSWMFLTRKMKNGYGSLRVIRFQSHLRAPPMSPRLPRRLSILWNLKHL